MATHRDLAGELFETKQYSLFGDDLAISCSQLLSWQNIQIVRIEAFALEAPEIAPLQHLIAVAASAKPMPVAELKIEGRMHTIPRWTGRNGIGIFPAHLPVQASWKFDREFTGGYEVTHCYLAPDFLKQIAYESVPPERVELMLALPPIVDPIVWQIVWRLQSVQSEAPNHSCLYIDSMATALATHLLKFYTTRQHALPNYPGGLSKSQLDRALAYIHANLSGNISLTAIASELGMSHYYFCRLFKQSMQITPHQYLIRQRIERAQHLLKRQQGNMIEIAIACGFANPSHFARCFRKQLGVSPKQFQMMQ